MGSGKFLEELAPGIPGFMKFSTYFHKVRKEEMLQTLFMDEIWYFILVV